MAFFDELGKAISGKSREAATKVRDLTEILQLKSKLSSEKEKVNKAYINLGKAYYDRHEASAEEEYQEDFDMIRTGLLKISELEEEIVSLEGTRICAECGAKVEKGAAFCGRCGAQMPLKQEETEETFNGDDVTFEEKKPQPETEETSSGEEKTEEISSLTVGQAEE